MFTSLHPIALIIKIQKGTFIMIKLKSGLINPVTQLSALVLVAAVLASCGTTTGVAVPVDQAEPSITYEYSDEEGLVNASFQAENYCKNYNAWPRVSQMERGGARGGKVTFTCGSEREEFRASSRSDSQPRRVDYIYRDEENLVDATIQAQKACARMGAEAKLAETRVNGEERTIIFECVD